jgi:NAD-dependent DNA ligase
MTGDSHGQPLNLYFNAAHRNDRAVHELLGLIRGVLIDGIVTPDEVRALDRFIAQNDEILGSFPANVLYERIHWIVRASTFDEHELSDLRGLLEDTIGEHAGVHDLGEQASTTLPLTTPAPMLRFEGMHYVVTGRFLFGARPRVSEEICRRGAVCENDVTLRTDVLLIGSLASRDWKHSSFGRKIEHAIALRAKGREVAIVAEDHWVSQLRG